MTESAVETAPSRRGLWMALGLALTLRVVWLCLVDTQPVTDFDWYFQRAVSLAQGHGYSVDGVATAYWPVGYPAFLAAFFKVFGASVWVGKALNTVLSLACVGLSWHMSVALTGRRRVADATAILLSVHPAYMAYSGILASEPLFAALSLLGAWLVATTQAGDRKRPWLVGTVFGLATLVRPQAVLLPLILVASVWLWDARPAFQGRAWRYLGVVYLALALCLVPWTARNWGTFGQFVFVSTNGGDNLLIGNSEGTTGTYLNPDKLGYDFEGLSEPARDKAATRAALSYARQHPGVTLKRWPLKLAGTFLSGTDAPYWAFQKEQSQLSVPGMGNDKPLFLGFQKYSVGFTWALLAAAGLGVLLSVVKRVRLPAMGLAVIGYSALLTVAFFGNARFAYPVVPFLALTAASGLGLSRHKRAEAGLD